MISQEIIKRRIQQMGGPVEGIHFPEDGVPMARYLPWWMLWTNHLNRAQFLDESPAISLAWDKCAIPLISGENHEVVCYAAGLPLASPEEALESLTRMVLRDYDSSISTEIAFGMIPPIRYLAATCEDRSAMESRFRFILEELAGTAGRSRCGSEITGALALAVAREGMQTCGRALALHIRSQHDAPLAVSIVAVLAKIGAFGTNVGEDDVIRLVHKDCAREVQQALSVVLEDDLDALDLLVAHEDWNMRSAALLLAEAALAKGSDPTTMLELVLARIATEEDSDVLMRAAMLLTAAVERLGESGAMRVVEVAAQEKKQRLRLYLAAIWSSGVVPADPLALEGLREKAVERGAEGVMALNRCLDWYGEGGGSFKAWLQEDVVLLLQHGSVKMPKFIQPWFCSHEDLRESDALNWGISEDDHRIKSAFMACYMAYRPELWPTLVQLFETARLQRSDNGFKRIGCLLAAAPVELEDYSAELRCCLGATIGGPVPESAATVGRLLAIAVAGPGDMDTRAMNFLSRTSAAMRELAANCLSVMNKYRDPASDEAKTLAIFGGRLVKHTSETRLPMHLQPLFGEMAPRWTLPENILTTADVALRTQSSNHVDYLDYEHPETYSETISQLNVADVQRVAVQLLASPEWRLRQCGAMIAGVAHPSILEGTTGQMLRMRLILVATSDPDGDAKGMAAKSCEALGIAVPKPPPGQEDAGKEEEDEIDSEEKASEELARIIRELEGN